MLSDFRDLCKVRNTCQSIFGLRGYLNSHPEDDKHRAQRHHVGEVGVESGFSVFQYSLKLRDLDSLEPC